MKMPCPSAELLEIVTGEAANGAPAPLLAPWGDNARRPGRHIPGSRGQRCRPCAGARRRRITDARGTW